MQEDQKWAPAVRYHEPTGYYQGWDVWKEPFIPELPEELQ